MLVLAIITLNNALIVLELLLFNEIIIYDFNNNNDKALRSLRQIIESFLTL